MLISVHIIFVDIVALITVKCSWRGGILQSCGLTLRNAHCGMTDAKKNTFVASFVNFYIQDFRIP